MQKHYYYFLLLLSITTFSIAQNVNIPDANFKNYLVNNHNINTNKDSEIQISEAQNYRNALVCIKCNITNLKGIEAFKNIIAINFNDNLLINHTVDLSDNKKLQLTNLSNNLLTQLDVSMLDKLEYLDCSSNSLTSLKLPQQLEGLKCDNNLLNTYFNNIQELENLLYLDANYNRFITLDLSKNKKLKQLYLKGNRLTSLNIANGNNHNFSTIVDEYNGVVFDASLNNIDKSRAINIDTSFCPPNDGSWLKDNYTEYSEKCTLSSYEYTLKNRIEIHPTITTDKLHINTNETIHNIEINNSNGQTLSVKLNKNTVDTSYLSSGIYFLKIKVNNQYIIKKFIKQ
ncbi:T9SS type A sorting domain-containing protein [Tenacibaculum sp. 190524A02b]|uniref:T9SS type A sorting domain-containing protein n=1 Tax=Tenacibaculum vairaonense TaxID=3137860 RepID=UPI0031FA670D